MGRTASDVIGKRLLGAMLACCTLAACGPPSPVPQPTAWRTDPGPAATATLIDCGTFDLPQGESLPEPAGRCLAEAVRSGRPARLTVTSPTTEGAPIPVTYTAGADGRVEVVTDSRQDGFGPQEITRQICTGPVAEPRLRFTECSEPTPK